MGKDTNTETPPAEATAVPQPAVTLEEAMAAFGKVETDLLVFQSVVEDLVHDEASSLRGLAATTLATLRSGKPGGA